MFEAEKVTKLNELEMLAFDYIIKEPEKAQEMTVRALGKTIHVSTSTIIRMAGKLGFTGWAELKYFLREQDKDQPIIFENFYENMISFELFLKKLSDSSFQGLLNRAVEMIHQARSVLFLGLGTSDSLAQYGTRYFNNLCIHSYAITDIFRPITAHEFDASLAILLSVSGETQQVITKAQEFRRAGAKIIAITNASQSTLSKLADLNLSYNAFNEYATPLKDVKLTTQLPVVAIIEILAHQAHKTSDKKIIH